jgi:hypothetical protein
MRFWQFFRRKSAAVVALEVAPTPVAPVPATDPRDTIDPDYLRANVFPVAPDDADSAFRRELGIPAHWVSLDSNGRPLPLKNDSWI